MAWIPAFVWSYHFLLGAVLGGLFIPSLQDSNDTWILGLSPVPQICVCFLVGGVMGFYFSPLIEVYLRALIAFIGAMAFLLTTTAEL